MFCLSIISIIYYISVFQNLPEKCDDCYIV